MKKTILIWLCMFLISLSSAFAFYTSAETAGIANFGIMTIAIIYIIYEVVKALKKKKK